MRVIIAGTREFADYGYLKEVCNAIFTSLIKKREIPYLAGNKDITIVSGTARGADQLGERFAREYGLSVKRLPAKWDTYGKGAGYRRNAEMSKYAKEDSGVLIAFWNGISKGTKHMIDLAKKDGLRVFIINYND